MVHGFNGRVGHGVKGRVTSAQLDCQYPLWIRRLEGVGQKLEYSRIDSILSLLALHLDMIKQRRAGRYYFDRYYQK